MILASNFGQTVNKLGTVLICSLKQRSFSTSSILYKLGEWRIKHGLPAKGREYGPLTDLPDWSYADGRPAPLTVGAKRRIMWQKEYCEKIMKLTKEVDECFELNKEKASMEEQRKQRAINNRLKSKGKSLV